MLKIIKVKLDPNKKQQQLIYKTFGSCRKDDKSSKEFKSQEKRECKQIKN